jgi:Transposase DDE domain group 1
VTNFPDTPQHVYTIYRQRGDVENRIKELKAGLALDRLSCSRFLGNQFRLLLTAAAYILVQALRLHAAGTSCATAQATTLRERLLKVAVWVTQSVRRIVLHLPTSFPLAARVVADCLRGRRAALTRSGSSPLIEPGRGVDVEPHCSMLATRPRSDTGWVFEHLRAGVGMSRGRTVAPESIVAVFGVEPVSSWIKRVRDAHPAYVLHRTGSSESSTMRRSNCTSDTSPRMV